MKNLVLSLVAVLLTSNFLFGQYDVSKINKKAIEAYNKGLEKAQDGKYKEAIESLTEAINRDPKYIDAYLSLAGVYGQTKDHKQSVATYEKAFTLDSNYTSDYRLPYSINLAGLGQFDKSLTTINGLLSRNNISPNTRKAATYRQKTYQFAVDYTKNEAIKNYEMALQLAPDYIEAKDALGKMGVSTS